MNAPAAKIELSEVDVELTLLGSLLVNDGAFALARWDGRDEDQYGRKLRVRDGQSLGMVLVAEGLARPWDGARRSWC